MKYMGKILLFLVLACPIQPPAAAQVTELRGRDVAEAVVRQHTERTTGFLSVRRREEIEDLFCSMVVAKCSGYARDPYFYEVSDEGYEFHEDGNVSLHLSVHGPFRYIVAVSAASGDSFRLAGFKDSRLEFNELATNYPIRLLDDSQAVDYARLYASFDPALKHTEFVTSALGLKQAIEKRFVETFDDFTEAQFKFDEWWHKSSRKLLGHPLQETVRRTQDGYAVTLYQVSSMKRGRDTGPSLLQISISISAKGQVTEPKFSPVDPNKCLK